MRRPRHWFHHKTKVIFRESTGDPHWMISIPSTVLAALPKGAWEEFSEKCGETFSYITIWHTRRAIHIEGEGAPPIVTTDRLNLGHWRFLDN